MGRRSQHTPDELRELILGATRRVVEEDGITQPSAREIARAIGYAPGTLYNMFHNLDEILLHVEARIFAELDAKIAAAVAGKKGREAIRHFTEAYVGFACENPRLWGLIIQHHPQSTKISPAWYLEIAYAPVGRLENALARTNSSADADEITRKARLIWAALHGLVQVAMTNKFGAMSRPAISTMAQELTEQFIAGMAQPAERREDGHRNGRVAGAAE
jgi:AcrR family transcriptional regulator